MSVADFIRDSVLMPRLIKTGSLVVYDPDGRYGDLCRGLASDRVRVVDASLSSIVSRETALEALCAVGRPNPTIDGLVVYVPAARPLTDEQKQVDPFSVFAACGSVFPADDGDDYLSLCLRAKPDHATEIRRLFAATPAGPTFKVIDAVGGGTGWPQLRAALNVDSAREILVALLAPSAGQAGQLKEQAGWVDEARAFFQATLGLGLKTRGKTWAAVADELWRYVLFSEFVFDLPGALPEGLKGVPRAPVEARPIVEEVCEQLRSGTKTQSVYLERAEAIEAELGLVAACQTIDDLGERDTFPFEERVFLTSAVRAVTDGSLDTVREILSERQNSIWLRKGESQAQWSLVRAVLELVECCEDCGRQLTENSRTQSALLDFYVRQLREADRLQREFEQAVGEFIDAYGLMDGLIEHARGRYRGLAERVQVLFTKHLEQDGWPPAGRLPNAAVFDRLVADRLKEPGRRVAYLMVDALRYELGVALKRLLDEVGPVELQAAYAQLPTITPVGMASLLPGAHAQLSLHVANDSLVPKLAGVPAGTVPLRMDVFAKAYGDRFAQMSLSDFVNKKPSVPETVDLLVLRSTEIDSQLENNPETTLSLIPGTLKLLRVSLEKLRTLGFKEAVVVTDHGFFLNAHAEAGDVCVKPEGTWTYNAHDRMRLGDGSGDTHNLVIDAGRVGVKGDFAKVAMPRTMAPYRSGHLYFHGGASLAEAVVPVLHVRLERAETAVRKVTVELSYKSGATRTTTRRPVIDVMLVKDDLFSAEASVEILIEAQTAKGEVVGEAQPAGEVNPATRTITLLPGQRKQITLRMDPEFEGKFSVKALNPTTLASYASVNLETDYTA